MLIWLCQLSGRYFVMLDFYLNQQYIAANLCENRNKPEMHCNGKCHLKKQLNEEDKKNQENPERRADNKSEIFYPLTNEAHIASPPMTADNKSYHYPNVIGIPVDQPSDLFRPPATC
ncbi:hypothetical protein CLV51_104332 [Chitinophaga niastensis]|uniref:Uncharacterized protein n=2 Tax=Chitinophaga niastensis TaxID=536980 RepID=A0A2P8HHF1_CHINA|nr:hypothetical protein CLV51_104332 [Chitinophaga niastensis]